MATEASNAALSPLHRDAQYQRLEKEDDDDDLPDGSLNEIMDNDDPYSDGAADIASNGVFDNDNNRFTDSSNRNNPNDNIDAQTPDDSETLESLEPKSNIISTASVNNNNITSDWDDDDDDFDQDMIGMRRYNLDFTKDTAATSTLQEASLPRRVFASIQQLRTAARQRQAARLLNMPSRKYACLYAWHARFMTYCCDATDAGIAVATSLTAVWILVGAMFQLPPAWWLTGTAVLIVRVSARRLVEYVSGRRQFHYQRQHVESIEISMGSDSEREIGASQTTSDDTTTLYRDGQVRAELV
jgi:hypothetical protein